MTGSADGAAARQVLSAVALVHIGMWQCGGGVSYPFTYAWNLDGQLQQVGYPSCRTVSYCLDAAGRPTRAVSGDLASACQGASPYVSGIKYAPSGGASEMTYGNSVVESVLYNSRMQVRQMEALKGSSLWKLENSYCLNGNQVCADNNGNLYWQKLTVGSWQPVVGYDYDKANRLTSAQEKLGTATQWTQNYGYADAQGAGGQYGNVRVTGDEVVPTSLSCGSYAAATNRCTTAGFEYDNNVPGGPGNITGFPGGRRATYDAENRQTSLTEATTSTYGYDGEGRRVTKSSGERQSYMYMTRWGDWRRSMEEHRIRRARLATSRQTT